MEPSDPWQASLVAIEVLCTLMFVGGAVWFGERARGDAVVMRSRQRVAYTCLLLAGALPVPPIGIAYLLAIRPIHDLRGYGMLLGVALGIPALGATIVGLFYMLMLLRVRHIQRVMLPVVVGFPVLIAVLRSEQWQRVALAAFLMSLIVVSSRGLAAVRRADSAAAAAP